jgi:hypothetical protein
VSCERRKTASPVTPDDHKPSQKYFLSRLFTDRFAFQSLSAERVENFADIQGSSREVTSTITGLQVDTLT